MDFCRITPDLSFEKASRAWLASRRLDGGVSDGRRGHFIKPNTYKSYKAYVDSLNLFFKDIRLDQIGLPDLRRYQFARMSGDVPFVRFRRPQDAQPHKAADGTIIPPKGKTACSASPKKCNQELSLLKTILSRAGCWTDDLEELYEPFIEEIADVPRALSPEEQERWLKVAYTDKSWWIVYWYSVVAFETSMSTNEMRALRIGDINLTHGIVNVPPDGAKNRYRARTIPLVTAEARWSMEQLLARAKDLGASTPLHYLFPFRRKNGPFDPGRAMTVSGIKWQWNEVRNASGLKWFRPYDTRHTAITRWAESGMPSADMMAMAGHVSERMTMHYTHISVQAKRRALQASMSRSGAIASSTSESQSPFYVRRNSPTDPQLRLPAATRMPSHESCSIEPEILLNPAVQAEIARQVALALQSNT